MMMLPIKALSMELILLLLIFFNAYPSEILAQSLDNKNIYYGDVTKIDQYSMFSLKCKPGNSNFFSVNFCKLNFSDSLVKVQRKKTDIKDRVKQSFKNYSSDFWYVASAPSRINKKSGFILGGVLTIGGVIFIYDQDIANAIERNRSNEVYKILVDAANFVEPMGISKLTVPVSVGCYAVGYVLKFEPMKEISYQVFESLTIAIVFKNIIANSIGRARPNSGKGPRFSKFGSSISFFSGHASNAFQAARIISHHVDFLPVTILCYGSALLVGFHRLDDEMHWASDVFIGAVYGTAVASAILKLNENRNIKVAPHISPDQGYFGLRATYQF